MEQLTVDEARSLLLEQDIKPMSALDGDEESEGRWIHPEREVPQLDDEAARLFEEGSVGLGVDIVEIERMRNILTRRPRFAEQVFSPEERAYCDKKANPATHYALRFAAKEAVVKALGTGFSDGIWVHDIEVERMKSGKPLVKLSGRALEVAEEQGIRDLSLSMSYTHSDAVACAMAITASSVHAREKRKDPTEELARQFKETRKMLDEL